MAQNSAAEFRLHNHITILRPLRLEVHLSPKHSENTLCKYYYGVLNYNVAFHLTVTKLFSVFEIKNIHFTRASA